MIESFDDIYTVGTYEQPDESGSIEDIQYAGRGSFPLLVTHTAQVDYTIDLSVQEGYETVPLNVYLVDADNYIKLQQEEEFESIDEGSKEPVTDTETFSFTVPAGLYYLVFGSSEVGRESTFDIDYTARQYLNSNTDCSSSQINVGHLSIEYTDSLFNVERWNLRSHIQYDGEAETEYELHLRLLSSDSETVVSQTQSQIEDCETNFVYSDEKSLNIVENGEKIMAEIEIRDESSGEVLAERTQEVESVLW
ncbi:hypothetical protein C475_08451 [Halosimplex carlsbadense 2-9-1]|uniref:Uncharacterized protein n=1 Tax=Halosimplex carlsbadense 2-9-1 TaxID=797114 RepID=M0CUP1_9EURY|nr:hypothetical protein C475_08451 [Halosimplex carlsbadense 2-9-1]